MSVDTEGYIVRCGESELHEPTIWVICDRYSVPCDDEPPHTSYSRALMRAAALNDAVHARRFA